MEPLRAQVAVLSVTGGAAIGVGMENVVADALTNAGHQVSAFESVKNSEVAIRAQLVGWIEDPDIDLVIIVGDGHNITKALAPLTDQPLPGFADLLRMLAFQEIGASAMLSTAEAARCNTTFVFVLPVGEAAVRAAMDKLILPQLDPATQPKNLISEMPRLREEGDFTRVDAEPAEDEGVPMAIVKEKTASGAGMVPRLPARPAAGDGKSIARIPDPVPRQRPSTQSRVKATTGKNVIVRDKVEDPTKPIELQKLEKQIELSRATGDSTKPMDLGRLPKLPPGANVEADDTARATITTRPASDHAVTKIAPAPERPAGSVGRVKPATTSRAPAPPIQIPRATPAAASPVVAAKPAKKPALIVDDPVEPPERPKAALPKLDKAIEEIEPDELDTIEQPRASGKLPEAKPLKTPSGAPAIVDLAALDSAVGQVSSPAHALSTEELEPLTEAEERETLERLPPAAQPKRPPTQPPPKRPPTQPPPEPRASRPPTQPPPEPRASRPPTQPPPPPKRSPTQPPPLVEIPLQTSGELPAGAFDYKVKKSKLPLVIALLLIAGIAVGAVVVLGNRGGTQAPKDAAQVAVEPPPVDAEAPGTVTPPDAPEEIEMEPIDAGRAPTRPTRPTRPTNPTNPNPNPNPTTGPVTKPEAGSADPKPEPTKPEDPKPETDPGCDETSCVIEKYARPCCAKYKPTGEGFTPSSNDSLSKPQIRAGIEPMRPAISRCGEQHPAKGTVKISVSVSSEGAVTSADVVEAPSPDLGKCVAGFVRKASFAKTANGGSFSYPFVF